MAGKIAIKVSRILLRVILTIFIVACVSFFVIFKFCDMSYYVILSGSMRPDIDVDDVVIMRDLDDVKAAEEVNVGDIAVYLEESKDSITSEKHYTYLTHRVYDKAVDEKGDTVFIFKGDNNNAVDKNTVKPYQIKGKYLCNIKGVGQAVEFLTSMSGIITLVAILCMLFSLDSLLTYILDKIYGDKKLSEPSDDANTTGTDGGNPEQ